MNFFRKNFPTREGCLQFPVVHLTVWALMEHRVLHAGAAKTINLSPNWSYWRRGEAIYQNNSHHGGDKGRGRGAKAVGRRWQLGKLLQDKWQRRPAAASVIANHSKGLTSGGKSANRAGRVKINLQTCRGGGEIGLMSRISLRLYWFSTLLPRRRRVCGRASLHLPRTRVLHVVKMNLQRRERVPGNDTQNASGLLISRKLPDAFRLVSCV